MRATESWAAAIGKDAVVSQRFRIVGKAGSGGMGTVYQAIDAHTDKTVALKLLKADSGRSRPEETQRFLRESQLLAQLHHPRIVGYVAHGISESGSPYLAMDWLEGEDLEQRLRREGLTLTESLTLVAHVADALAVAHQQGIIHRG